MGIFSKLKNMITGGGAKVTIEAVEPALRQPFTVKINVVVSDADLKIKRVYLKIAGEETVVVKDVEIARRTGDEVEVDREDVEGSTITHEQEIEVDGEQTLEAKKEYNWETQVSLPDSVLPTYRGLSAAHEWRVFVGLDVTGNDPDSGWVELEMF